MTTPTLIGEVTDPSATASTAPTWWVGPAAVEYRTRVRQAVIEPGGIETCVAISPSARENVVSP